MGFAAFEQDFGGDAAFAGGEEVGGGMALLRAAGAGDVLAAGAAEVADGAVGARRRMRQTTVAPSSIMAWLWSPAALVASARRLCGTSAAA